MPKSKLGNMIAQYTDDIQDEGSITVIDAETLDDRIDTMKKEVEKGVLDERIHQIVGKILKGVPSRDELSEIKAMFDFVRENVRYTKDVRNVETFRKPYRTIQLGYGDCDDLTMLLACLLKMIGFHCFFKVIGLQANEFQHIYLLVIYPQDSPSNVIPLDPSRPEDMGWELPKELVKNVKVYNVEDEEE
jgi:hypothetical protein